LYKLSGQEYNKGLLIKSTVVNTNYKPRKLSSML